MFRASALARTFALLALGVALACGGSDSPTSPATQKGTVVMKNNSSMNILVVNIARCEEPSWGPDRLGASETIAPGAQRSWQFDSGCYDVRARSSAGDQEFWDVPIAAGKTETLTVTSFEANIVSAMEVNGSGGK